MALDTRERRASALNMTVPGVRCVLPNPSGIVSEGDRQTLCFLYSGVGADEASGGQMAVRYMIHNHLMVHRHPRRRYPPTGGGAGRR